MNAELRGLTVRVDTGRWSGVLLSGVDLVVPAGQVTAVLGGPGAGKSMLAAALAGRLPAAAEVCGQVRVNGEVVEGRRWPRLWGSVVGFVPQDGVTAFEPGDTVGAQLRRVERRHRAWTVERACAAASYPGYARDLLPAQHSGGQIQRAALAAALLPAPLILIADGPTNSLDPWTAHEVWTALRDYADAGAAVLVVSNEIRMLVTEGFADRLVIVHAGAVIAAGTPGELAESTQPMVRLLLGAAM
ncbi:ATP-binding cassette domain-containing protein [Nocardia thailandica]|uniref:ATP-binding cassette domain-containing protein n=1 Tax=Nocardia thailandica TaxID=257275 RepID=UPI0005BDD108|nr:ATP-binding cassette domain-containing protein [Nocardia thailandica]